MAQRKPEEPEKEYHNVRNMRICVKTEYYIGTAAGDERYDDKTRPE
jgi:hypothetical protein